MKESNASRILFLLFLMLILTINLTAMGAREDSAAYKADRKMVFDQLMIDIYNSEEGNLTAENKLKDLRDKYDIAYTDEEGILDAIIDRAKEQTITRYEAEFYFDLLQEGKLMEYRQEASRVKYEEHHRELISLLKQNLESSSPGEDDAATLLTVLNNYYNFVGLEYDDEYSKLSALILKLGEGRITSLTMMSTLNSMDHQLANNSIQNNYQKNAGKMSQNSIDQTADSNVQQETGAEASQAASPQGAGSSAQDSQGSGMNSNTRK